MKKEIQELKESLSVGQTVWIYDGNRRSYGKNNSRPIYSGFFHKQIITKLTRAGVHINSSLDCNFTPKKVSYKDLYGSSTVFFSKEAVENNGLLQENSYFLMEHIKKSLNFNTYEKLLKMFPEFEEKKIDMSKFDE